jgi:hypothetical protein
MQRSLFYGRRRPQPCVALAVDYDRRNFLSGVHGRREAGARKIPPFSLIAEVDRRRW